MKITFSLSGREQLKRNLERKARVLDESSAHQVLASCQRTTVRAKALAPVRTGALRASIDYRAQGQRGEVGVSSAPSVTGANPATYARHVEHGTRYVPAHPFMRPAAEAEKGPFVAGMLSIGRDVENK